MFGTDDLMNEELGVVFTVDVAASAVEVVGVFLFVLSQRRFGLEMFETLLVGTFDLVAHLDLAGIGLFSSGFDGLFLHALFSLGLLGLFLLGYKLLVLGLNAGPTNLPLVGLEVRESCRDCLRLVGVGSAWDGTVSRSREGTAGTVRDGGVIWAWNGNVGFDQGRRLRPLMTGKHGGRLG